MVSRFHGDDVSAEIGSEKKAERADLIGPFWFPPREGELSKLLVWSKHYHLGSKYNTSFLVLIVIDLYSSIVRNSERDDFVLVTFELSRWAAYTH